jgi:ATP-binding cassette subfamily F protein 3
VFEPVSPFSGGEKARLVLALVAYRRPNLLLLDEPTNHLDLEMRQALAMALQDYTGAVVLVSHDRHLLRTVSDAFLIVHGGRVAPFDGDIEDYARWLAETQAAATAVASGATVSPRAVAAESAEDRRQRKREEAERRARLAPLRAQVERCEKRLATLAAQASEIETQLADPALYEFSNKARLLDLTSRRAGIAKETAGIETQWLEASEALEQAAP